MNEPTHPTSAIKTSIRHALRDEWAKYGFFPCYAAVNLRGDPTLQLSDLKVFFRSRTAPLMKLATALCWPLRALQALPGPTPDGAAGAVPTRSRWSARFHTFFTDAYFYDTIGLMTREPGVDREERRYWEDVLLDMVNTLVGNAIDVRVDGSVFKAFEFFPPKVLDLDESTAGGRLLRLSGLDRIDADADVTFVVLEMLRDIQATLHHSAAFGSSEEKRRLVAASLGDILDRPYWRLAKYYQFRPDGVAAPRFNYTDVDATGGVSTWFARKPKEAPDLVVNVNVLRAMLVNRRGWSIFEDREATEVAQGIVGFLHRNVKSGLFRAERGYAYYIPDFFCSMFGRLWRSLLTLEPSQRHLLDPERALDDIRSEVAAYLASSAEAAGQRTNALDAALRLGAAVRIGLAERSLVARWQRVIQESFAANPPHWGAYEIFKGKIPTRIIYGSECTTAAFVYDALTEADHALSIGGQVAPRVHIVAS